MRLKAWVTSLAVLCVVAAGPADAAKISFSDQGWIDAGALIQTWFRVTQDSNAARTGPSYDIFLRRARLLLSGQFNNYIGFIASTDVSYTFAQTGLPAPVDPLAAQDAVRFHSPFIVINEILGTFKLCKEFEFDAGLMLIPWTHQALTSSAKFAGLDEQTYVTKRGYPAGIQGRGRDVGLLIRGLLIGDFLYYRLGVFNGVQTAPGTAVTTAVNPGDSLNFAGTIRFNILGKDDGYAWCGMCFEAMPRLSIGVGYDIQPRAVRPGPAKPAVPPVPPAPANPGSSATYESFFADLFLDLPFGDNEFSAEGAWVRSIYKGNGSPLNGTSYALINNTGNGFYFRVALRIAFIAPVFGMDWWSTPMPSAQVTTTTLTYLGTYPPAGGRIGDVTEYHIGLNFYPEKTTFNIKLDFSLENKENAGSLTPANGTTPVFENQWAATVQFQWAI